MKVLYILGTQRGGTTIVGRILGQLPGVAYAGEVRRFWEFGTAPGRRCGCGELVAECPVWSVVLDRVTAAGINPSDVASWQREVAPTGGSWRPPRDVRRADHGAAGAGYDRALGATYAGLAKAYGVEILIDNSKLPRDGALLVRTPGVTPYYLHVVRDARGVVASQLRRRPRQQRVARSAAVPALAAGWVMRHARSDQVAEGRPAQSLRLRYEDFVADPGAAAEAVGRLLGIPPPPRSNSSRFELPAVHTPRGPNPSTSTTLVEDTSWRRELSAVERGLVATLTAPWLAREGYLGRRGRSRPSRR